MKKVVFLLFIWNIFQISTSQTISDMNNKFGFDLLQQLKHEKENVFFSPYSISSALFMTAAGAKNNTEKEMLNVLCLDKNDLAFHKEFGEHQLQVENKKKIELKIANSIWKQKNYSFRENYLSLLKTAYKSVIFDADFLNNTEKERVRINKWVESKTKDKIKDILKSGILKQNTKLVLVNAIYFYGGWEKAFDEKKTKEDVFYLNDNATVNTKFMNATYPMLYASDDMFELVSIPYQNNEASLIVFLPKSKANFEKAVKSLTIDRYQKLEKKLSNQKVNLIFPKFKTTSSFKLDEVLPKMGMKDAFGDNADFSGMTGDKSLFISKVIHKAFVEVNEKGTEAAVATVVIMNRKSMAPKENIINFKADHPFIFMIKDNSTGQILFTGILNNPNK